MAETPDLRPRAGIGKKGIVRGNTAIQVQPHNPADMIAQILRVGALTAIADAEEYMLVVKRDAAAEVPPRAGRRIGDQQILPVDQAVLIESCPRQRGCRFTFRGFTVVK